MGKPIAEERSPARESTRYEDDLYTWVAEQVELLRAGRLDKIDAENIAEELSDVGSEQYDKLESSLRVLLMHMLKWDHQFEKRSASWVASIREHRRRIVRILKKNPGLKPRIDEAVAEGYEDAIGWAALETGIFEGEFPRECPYDWDDILERPFEMDPER